MRIEDSHDGWLGICGLGEGGAGSFFYNLGELEAHEMIDFFNYWFCACRECFKPWVEHADFLYSLTWRVVSEGHAESSRERDALKEYLPGKEHRGPGP